MIYVVLYLLIGFILALLSIRFEVPNPFDLEKKHGLRGVSSIVDILLHMVSWPAICIIYLSALLNTGKVFNLIKKLANLGK